MSSSYQKQKRKSRLRKKSSASPRKQSNDYRTKMRRLRYKPKEFTIRYPEDVKQIINAFKNQDIIISEQDAASAWYDYSEELCASWLITDGIPDEDIVECCSPYLTDY
jgi:hypothetical protein